MISCVIKLGNIISYSIVYNNKLIYHSNIDDLSELPNHLNHLKVDSMRLLIQGVPVLKRTEDAFIVSEIQVSGRSIPLAIKDTDQDFFVDLATTLAISDVKIYSYMDYVKHKFRDIMDCIVVCNYIDDYGVFHLCRGEIDNFSKVSRVNLTQKISKFKSLYKGPVYNMESFFDNSVLEVIDNLDKVPKESIVNLDYLGFVMSVDGMSLFEKVSDLGSILQNAESEVKNGSKECKNLVKEEPKAPLIEYDEDDDDDDYGFEKDFANDDDEDEDDDEVSEGNALASFDSLPTRKGKKEKDKPKENKGFKLFRKIKENDNEALNDLLSLISIILVGLSIIILLLAHFNKGNVKDYKDEVKSKHEVTNQLSSVQNKSVDMVADLYNQGTDKVTISYCGYYGSNVYVNANTDSLDDLKSYEDSIKKSYKIHSKTSDTYNARDGSVKYVTKYCLVSKG